MFQAFVGVGVEGSSGGGRGSGSGGGGCSGSGCNCGGYKEDNNGDLGGGGGTKQVNYRILTMIIPSLYTITTFG